MYFSILSENKITPIRSLLADAEKASTAQSSVINSLLSTFFVPNIPEFEMSTINITVSSLSSSKTLTNGSLNRAVTFRSDFFGVKTSHYLRPYYFMNLCPNNLYEPSSREHSLLPRNFPPLVLDTEVNQGPNIILADVNNPNH